MPVETTRGREIKKIRFIIDEGSYAYIVRDSEEGDDDILSAKDGEKLMQELEKRGVEIDSVDRMSALAKTLCG